MKKPYNISLDDELIARVRAIKLGGIKVTLTAVIDALLREWVDRMEGKERENNGPIDQD